MKNKPDWRMKMKTTLIESVKMLALFAAIMVVLFLSITTSMAASYLITCDPPTARTDTTPFDASTELKQYNWYVNGTLQPGSSPVCEYLLNEADGTYDVRASSVDMADREGPQSSPKDFTLVTAAPNAPANLR